MALRGECGGDVAFDARTLRPCFVETVDQKQGAALDHRLTQHAIERRTLVVLNAKGGVDPVGLVVVDEGGSVVEQLLLEALGLDQDGDPTTRVACIEQVHDEL